MPADAYTATVVGAIGLALAIFALLLIVIIVGWIVLVGHRRRNPELFHDDDFEGHKRPLNGGKNAAEGPEKSKKAGRWKTDEKFAVKPQVLRKEPAENLKEMTTSELTLVVNGAKHGSRSTFEDMDPPTIYKKRVEEGEDVKVINITDEDQSDVAETVVSEKVITVSQPQQQKPQQPPYTIYTADTLRQEAELREVRPSGTKMHGYYGPYAQESDSFEKD